MSKSHGMMVGCQKALDWVSQIETDDTETKDCVLNRMRYEFDKDIEVPVKIRKGIYGHKFDEYLCGNCGSSVKEAWFKWCPNCGYRIGGR